MKHPDRVKGGREGGRSRHVGWCLAQLARYQHLDRDQAILQAWKDGRQAGKQAKYRARERAQRSA